MVQLMSLGIDRLGMIQDGAALRALELGWFVSPIRPKIKLMMSFKNEFVLGLAYSYTQI